MAVQHGLVWTFQMLAFLVLSAHLDEPFLFLQAHTRSDAVA